MLSFLAVLSQPKPLLLAMLCITLACACDPARAEDPATQAAPQTQPAVAAGLIKRWFDQLSDADPNLRDDATDQLMQLKRDDLPILRKVVQEALPLTPTQMEALPEIVSQVYLSGERYEVQPDAGFLGIQTSVVDIASAKDDRAGRSQQRNPGGQASGRFLRLPAHCGTAT